MSAVRLAEHRGSYGVDAPGVVLAFVGASAASLALAGLVGRRRRLLAVPLGASGLWFAVSTAAFLHATRAGKFAPSGTSCCAN